MQGLANHTILISKGKQEYIIEDSAAPIKNDVGDIQGVVLIFRDVTKQKLLEKERERSLKAEFLAKEDLEDFFMQSPLPMVILEGPEHVFTLANPPYEKLIGRKANGKKLFEVFNPEEIKVFTSILSKVYESGVPYIGKEMHLPLSEIQGVNHDHWIDISLHPTRSVDGKVKGILAIVQDVTEARRAKQILIESESNFRAFADSTPQMVFTTNPEGGVDYINPRWYEYSLLTEEQTLGDAYASSLHPDDVQGAMVKWKHSISTATRFDNEHRFRRGSDGMYRWFRVQIEPKFENGTVLRWYGTMTDVHDQKMFSQELAEARDGAERANKIKSAFLANMSHEIRTPLGAILGFTDLLKDARLTGEEREYLNVILRNGQALSHVINDILDLSKVESGQLSIEYVSFDLRALVKEVVQSFSDIARSKEITLQFKADENSDCEISSDPTRIRQVIMNLVGNAIKFTSQGGVKVFVSIDPQNDSKSLINIRVEDTGTGINTDQAKMLFQPFMQADNSTARKFGGTGLGLALSKRLANALEGDVSIESSELDKGSLFLFSFAAQTSEKSNLEEVLEVSSPKIGSGSMKLLKNIPILVIDDSPDNRVLMEIMLGREGALIDEASSGEEGVTLAMKNDYAVVLMDIQMPGMDGYDALLALKKLKYKKPVIALTAHAMAEEKRRTLSAGFADHVTKPVDAALLVTAILKHV